MKPLLTPLEVAELLQLSKATVYAKAVHLGGFFPAGIKALRFNPEVIYAIMEGSRQVPNPISVSGPTLQQDRVPHQKGRRKVAGGETDGTGDPGQDPAITADAIRFGLRAPDAGRVDGRLPKDR